MESELENAEEMLAVIGQVCENMFPIILDFATN
jgi:hypothetical protein